MGLRVYGDIDFKGPSAAFVRDTPDVSTSGLSQTISSVVVADGEVWEVCPEPRFAGRCRRVDSEISDLRRGGWNDRIASVRRLRGGAVRTFADSNRPPGPAGLHIYGDINFRGKSASLTADAPDLAEHGMSTLASSLRIDPDEVWQVCTEAGYRGRCLVVNQDQSDLRRGDWNDVIVSARRLRGRPQAPSGGRVAFGLDVYADINFRGRSATLISNTADVNARGLARTISSLRVADGEVWEVCTETNYRGRCDVVGEDMSDLRRGEWNDVIASARRIR